MKSASAHCQLCILCVNISTRLQLYLAFCWSKMILYLWGEKKTESPLYSSHYQSTALTLVSLYVGQTAALFIESSGRYWIFCRSSSVFAEFKADRYQLPAGISFSWPQTEETIMTRHPTSSKQMFSICIYSGGKEMLKTSQNWIDHWGYLWQSKRAILARVKNITCCIWLYDLLVWAHSTVHTLC